MAAAAVFDDVRPGGEPDMPAPEQVAGGLISNPVTTAVVVGGAFAAGAGAYLGTRALARRNARHGRPINSVMANAITACDVKSNDGRSGR